VAHDDASQQQSTASSTAASQHRHLVAYRREWLIWAAERDRRHWTASAVAADAAKSRVYIAESFIARPVTTRDGELK